MPGFKSASNVMLLRFIASSLSLENLFYPAIEASDEWFVFISLVTEKSLPRNICSWKWPKWKRGVHRIGVARQVILPNRHPAAFSSELPIPALGLVALDGQ